MNYERLTHRKVFTLARIVSRGQRILSIPILAPNQVSHRTVTEVQQDQSRKDRQWFDTNTTEANRGPSDSWKISNTVHFSLSFCLFQLFPDTGNFQKWPLAIPEVPTVDYIYFYFAERKMLLGTRKLLGWCLKLLARLSLYRTRTYKLLMDQYENNSDSAFHWQVQIWALTSWSHTNFFQFVLFQRM